MGRVDDVGELFQIEDIPLGDDVRAQIDVADVLLVFNRVDSRAADLSALDCFDKRVGVDKLASRSVDKKRAALHHGDSLAAEEVPVFVRVGDM